MGRGGDVLVARVVPGAPPRGGMKCKIFKRDPIVPIVLPRLRSEPARGLVGEVLGVTTEELLGVVGKEIDLLADASGFAGLQAADPRVAVDADVDAFEQFEGAVAGNGE